MWSLCNRTCLVCNPTANGNHTYPKADSLEYSLAFSHNSYSYPLTFLVHYKTH